MSSLQYLTLATVISISGLGTIQIAEAKTSIIYGRSVSLAADNNKINNSILAKGDRYYLAQNSSDNKQSPETEDEMIKELQKRDQKIEGFKDMLKIDGILPDTDSADKDSVDTGDEMMDAVQKRQNKIQNLKELKQAEERLNKQKLSDLQEQGINVENTEDIKKIQAIVNNDNLDNEAIFDALQKQNINIENTAKLEAIRTIVNAGESPVADPDNSFISATTAFRMFTIGIPVTILVFLIGRPIVKGIAGTFKSNIDEKFGKPKVPDGSITLHNNAFKKITIIGNKAENINDEKFGNEEFKLLIQIKIDIAKKTEGYVKLAYGVELLKAAIIAQKSFLKLESTELRYRSRKQQEFYQYVADNLEENVDKEAFAKKVKKKQIEILPLITTEEGRVALESYAKEIKIISQYDLGLKLLTLFKQYELKDFSILKTISDTIEGLQGQDLFSPKGLISLVLEKYEAFEKLAPILGISEAESSPSTYARILQVIGLENRHGKSYLQFKQLVELLKSWEKPYKTINMVREEYTPDRYQIPAEFKQEIPGIETYKQYVKYLADL